MNNGLWTTGSVMGSGLVITVRSPGGAGNTHVGVSQEQLVKT